ncbi:hypothetical protein JCM9279_007239 [Rhodotorula babjevae]
MSDRPRSDSRTSYRSTRPASAQSAAAPPASSSTRTVASSSSLAYSARPPQHPKTPKPSAARYGGLAERDLQKLQSSIRAASKTAGHAASSHYRAAGTAAQPLDEADEPADDDDSPAHPAPEGSFIAEASFSRAPINSRLPHISPHRVVSSSLTAAAAARRRSHKDKHSQRHARDEHDPSHSDSLSDSGSTVASSPSDDESPSALQARRRQLGLDKEPLSGLTAELQEALVTEDLLSVLGGIEGRYVEFDPEYAPEDEFDRLQGAHFVVDPALDPRIAALVRRFLPLATYYTGVTAFVEEFSVREHGTVNHALCAAIREVLRDYLVLLARLEDQFHSSSSFTLQRFWLVVHPALDTLELVHALTTEVVALGVPAPDDDDDDDDDEGGSGAEGESSEDDGYGAGLGDVLAELNAASAAARPASSSSHKRAPWRFGPALGGETLHLVSALHTRTRGNPRADALYAHLLLRAAQPYARTLVGWVERGELDDPWDEFCVREQRGYGAAGAAAGGGGGGGGGGGARGDEGFTDEYWERRYTLRGERAAGSAAAGAGSGSSRAHGKAPLGGQGLSSAASSAAAGGGGLGDRPRERGLARGAVVPDFLEPWLDKVLLAGKYLNVIRECGIEVEVPVPSEGATERDDGLIDMQEEGFFRRIETAYTYANKTLLKLLLEEEHLVSRLETIKQYFFINHGDVFTHFLDMADRELGKRKKRIMLERLQTQLDLALLRAAPPSTAPTGSTSADGTGAFKDDLRIVFDDVTVAEWLLKVVNQTGALVGPDGVHVDEGGKKQAAADKQAKDPGEHTGWDVFNLDYSLTFPLSLVLSRRSITFYQMIFRHLLRLRHLERVFQDTWTEHLKTPAWRRRSPYPELQAWKGRVFALRARMYDFIQQMFDFAVSEVLEVRWAELRAKLEKCETVDELLHDHDDFLNSCTNECLLTNEKLLDLFHQRLFNTCYVFANYTSSFTKIVVTCEAQANGDWARLGGEFKKHWEFLSRFEIHFNHHISQALSFLQLHAARENSGILPLIVRLSSLKMDEAPRVGAGAGAATLASPSTTTTATGAGLAASQRAQLQRSAQCLRSRFVRTPPSCVQHKKARRGRQQPPAPPPADLGSDPSPPLLHPAARAGTANKRASPHLPPTRVPAAGPPSLAHHRPTLSSPTPPTVNTARSTSTPTPAASLAGPAAAVPTHLLVLAAVVLLGGGYLVYTLAPRSQRPSAPKDQRRPSRPSQHTLNRIRQAQEAAATDEVPSSTTSGGTASSSSSSAAAPARGPLKLVTAGLPAASAAAFSELLPSPACVASTSAAIMSGLERIGSAVGAATAGARGRARTGSASAKGKERVTDDAELDECTAASGTRSPLPSAGLTVPASSTPLEGLTRRAKGKKGAKAGALPSPAGSTSSVASSSQRPTRASAPRAGVREIGVSSDKVATTESAVQTVGIFEDEAQTPLRGRRTHGRDDSDPTPPFSTPAPVPHPPGPPTAEASVQTSPRLLALAPPARVPASPALGRVPLPAPVARPPILPLPSDLHASFQSTPLDPPRPPRSVPSSSESNASSSSYPIPTSPPLSPLSRSRSPTNSSAHRSSSASASASASVSASPTSRRAALPSTNASRRESATSSINGHLAVDANATPSRPRGSRRKSGAAGVLASADDAPQPRSVVGLPGAVAAPRKGKGDERGGGGGGGLSGGGGKAKAREREREKDKERDWDDEREQRQVLRRPSTASSSSASGASGKGAQGLGLGMSRSAPSRGEDRERDDEAPRQGADGGRRDMHGLGVEMRDSGGRGGGGDDVPLDGGYPFPSTGQSDSSGPGAYSNGTHTPGWTPDSSPHPTQRSLSGSSYGAALATPTAQRPPWSPQLMAQQYTMIPAPASTRPPSRGSSLSAPPPGMAPLTPLHGPTAAELLHHESQQQQQQQMQVAHQQQQQQAYALAHAHAQAQVQAQYQHAVAIQLQVQQHHQQQQQQQLVQQQQQQQIVQQQQQRQQQQMRRRSTMPDPGDGYDGFLSPTAGAAPPTPSGFVYPLSAVASPPMGSTSASSPLLSSFAAQHHSQQLGSYGLSQGASPTTGSFPSSVQSAHAAAVAAAMYSYAGSPSPAGTYLASPASNNGSPYAHAHASPTQAHFQQSQLSRSAGPSAALARPRLQSSVSAVASLGGNGKGGSSGGGGSSSAGQGLSQSLGASGGGGGKSSRSGGGADKAGRSPSTPAGHGSSGSSAPMSGGVQLGEPPGAGKNRLRQVEMDADRTAKELEIARWKLAVLEDERKTAEIENQEALRALAARAMRAEARIKLFEEAAKTQPRSSPIEPTSSTPASSAAPSTSASPVVNSALLPVAALTPIFPEYSGSSSPTSSAHPLSWLDLDAVSFQGPRSLHPSSRSPSLLSSPSGGNTKSRNKRQSGGGGGGGRRTSSNQRRKSSTSPSAAPVAPPELIDSDDDDVLIVLDAPMRRRSANPLRQTPSRRSSYAPDDEAPDGGPDGASLVDDDDIPTIDVDESEPLSGGALMGESEDGTRQHREYIGFLPSRLSPRRVFAVTASPTFDAVECSAFIVENGNASLSVPSFTLDASPEPEDEDEPDSAPPVAQPHAAPATVAGLDSPVEVPAPIIETSGLPSAAQAQSLSPVSPTSPDDKTPRMRAPFSPTSSTAPTSPERPLMLSHERRTSSLPSTPRRPEDTPLPPSPASPLVHASA